jgi:glycogen operon protein
MHVWPGKPTPLGATYDGHGTNFALFSGSALAVELCLFDERGDETTISLAAKTDQVWHGYVPWVAPGQQYGYRVHGPYAPDRGLRFNPARLLIDPYARAITGPIRWSDDIYGYTVTAGLDDRIPDLRDNAASVPKSVVVDSRFEWGHDTRPRTPFHKSVIYECHVKGMTMCHPGVPAELRGKYLGLSSPVMLQHFRSLGVTAVELLPVHQHVVDRHLAVRGLTNYWGYNTVGYFAPDARYATKTFGHQVAEFKTMVKQFHAAGIEVILDVVYNHTGEGNHEGPTLSMKGIDNAAYYRLEPDTPRLYTDFTGTGNSLNMRHPRTVQLVMDSLRYWVDEMHVDGFRFDLAPTLARESNDFQRGSAFFDVIQQDPVLMDVKLIAEPWDVAPGGYQMGNFPERWSEWNGKYRDAVRRFWRGEPGMVPEVASRVAGSSDVFAGSNRGTYASLNFITAHDGYTLRDLVSYEQKHNEANGEHNADGTNDNLSRNWGIEGDTTNASIVALRFRLMRSYLATLAFSQGVPMLSHGDELARTQLGNNNAYAQDNEITWLDWSLSPGQEELLGFAKRVIAIRQAHPALRRRHFFTGQPSPRSGKKDVTWIHPDGNEFTDVDWRDSATRVLGMLIDGAATDEVDDRGEPVTGQTLLVLMNAGDTVVPFTLPALDAEDGWMIMLDTARDEMFLSHDGEMQLEAHALMLLALGQRAS